MTQHETARVERGPVTEVPHFALGMAALLERQGFTVAANELRRLHAQRDALLEALKLARLMLIAHGETHAKIDAAIAKAEDAPPQRKPLNEDEAWGLIEQDSRMEEYGSVAMELVRAVERAHGIT